MHVGVCVEFATSQPSLLLTFGLILKFSFWLFRTEAFFLKWEAPPTRRPEVLCPVLSSLKKAQDIGSASQTHGLAEKPVSVEGTVSSHGTLRT